MMHLSDLALLQLSKSPFACLLLPLARRGVRFSVVMADL